MLLIHVRHFLNDIKGGGIRSDQHKKTQRILMMSGNPNPPFLLSQKIQEGIIIIKIRVTHVQGFEIYAFIHAY